MEVFENEAYMHSSTPSLTYLIHRIEILFLRIEIGSLETLHIHMSSVNLHLCLEIVHNHLALDIFMQN